MNRKLKKSSTIKNYQNYNRAGYEKIFINVECPSCSSDRVYLYGARSDSIGHCHDCGVRWIEGDELFGR